MKNRITITIEVDDRHPADINGKVMHALSVVRDRIADYVYSSYQSVHGPEGVAFEPPQGGCADHGDDAYVHVRIQEVDDEPETTHTAACEEYWDRGLDCQCIPEDVKQAIRDGADPSDVM